MALRRTAALSKLLSNPLRPTHFAPATVHSFNTNSQMSRYESDGERSEDDVADRRVQRLTQFAPSIFSDLFGGVPFVAPIRAFDQMLTTTNPFMTSGQRREWDVKEDKEGLQLRIDMPGLGKEDVKVSVERNTLVIRGEEGGGSGEKESSHDGEDGGVRRYLRRIDLPEKVFKLDGIKAEMKNGVLKVAVPRVKEEERADVHHVQIE